jgi:flagellum-specific peptidoglycan hydrolase FlgJ
VNFLVDKTLSRRFESPKVEFLLGIIRSYSLSFSVVLALIVFPLACGQETRSNVPDQNGLASGNDTGEQGDGQQDPSQVQIRGDHDSDSKKDAPIPDGATASPPPVVGENEPDESKPSPSSSPSPVHPFTDIDADPRRMEISEAFARQLVTGRSPTRFEPEAELRREELAAIIYNALEDFRIGLPKSQAQDPTGTTYQDVDAGRWSAAAIEALANLGIMSGTGKGLFEPEQSVTRAQVMAAIHGAVQKARVLLGEKNPLPVVVPRSVYQDTFGHWAASRIAEMSGYCHSDQGTELDSETFRPDDLSSRSHATGVLIRALICFQTGNLPEWASAVKTPVPGEPAPNKPAPIADVLRLCESTVPSERRSALDSLRRLNFGARTLNYAAMPKSHERCVLELLPAALYTNLKTGVPASILIGQAIQETGWCSSELSMRGRNFHGQKAKYDVSNFSYWKGSTIDIYSSESPSGGGRMVKSRFMAFSHPDHSFYSVAERFEIPGLPYQSCMARRSDTVGFIRCVGRSWAVHSDYADLVLEHRAEFRAPARPALRLGTCDLKVSEWALDPAFSF